MPAERGVSSEDATFLYRCQSMEGSREDQTRQQKRARPLAHTTYQPFTIVFGNRAADATGHAEVIQFFASARAAGRRGEN